MTVTNVTPPTITGSAVRGSTLTATNGTWTYSLDYLTYTYQWERCDSGGASCVDIGGATSQTYAVQNADVGSTIRVEVTATEHAITPPPVNDAYYTANFTQFTNPPFTTIQTYSGSGNNTSFPMTQSPDGRVACVAAPDAVGNAWRFELRNGDLWPSNTAYMRSDLQWNGHTEWNQSGINVGDIRWFDIELWLPLGEFDYPRTNWMRLVEPHTGAPTWSCFSIVGEGMSTHPAWMTLKLAGGTQGSTQYMQHLPIFQMTNANGSWYTPNFNRRMRLRWGGRWAPDFTGWYEFWVDNVNVLPRTNHPTMWAGDTGEYLKAGPYISASSNFPSGKTVFYITKLDISYSIAP